MRYETVRTVMAFGGEVGIPAKCLFNSDDILFDKFWGKFKVKKNGKWVLLKDFDWHRDTKFAGHED